MSVAGPDIRLSIEHGGKPVTFLDVERCDWREDLVLWLENRDVHLLALALVGADQIELQQPLTDDHVAFRHSAMMATAALIVGARRSSGV